MEEWKIIKEYPDYVISSLGKIKREISRPYRPCCELKPWKHSTGCLCVTLRKEGKRKSIRVHILVAKAFLPNTNSLPSINHIDGNRTNNSLCNLEWSSMVRQAVHAVVTSLHKSKGYSFYRRTGKWIAYIEFNKKSHHLGYFNSEKEAQIARKRAEEKFHKLEVIR